MTEPRFHPWPPFDAPRTTTSPTVGELLSRLEEDLRAARPGWWRYELRPGEVVELKVEKPTALLAAPDLDATLEEVLRLQARESKLRRSLEELYELSLLLTSQRDQAAAVLLGVGEALKKGGAHVDAALDLLEAENPAHLDTAKAELRQAAAALEPGAIETPPPSTIRRYLAELAQRSQEAPDSGGGFGLGGEYTTPQGGTPVASDTEKKGD